MSQPGEQAEIHQHSGWLIPLGLALVILALCGAFLLYDLRPGTGLFRNNAPTADASTVQVSVRGVKFEVPAIIWIRAPRGGAATWILRLRSARAGKSPKAGASS